MSMIFDVDSIANQTEWFINNVVGNTETLKEKWEDGTLFDTINEYFEDYLLDEDYEDEWELESEKSVRGYTFKTSFTKELTTAEARELDFEIIIDEQGNVFVG